MADNSLGKIGGALLSETILGRLGAADPEVLAGPRAGVDIGVLRVAPGVVMAVTTDPVFVLPSLGWEQAAWFAVHILASDAATSGLPLRAMSVDLNLPAELPDQRPRDAVAGLRRGLRGAWDRRGERAHRPLRRLHLADGRRRHLPRPGSRRQLHHAHDGPAG